MSDAECGKYDDCEGCLIHNNCEWDNKWEKPNE